MEKRRCDPTKKAIKNDIRANLIAKTVAELNDALKSLYRVINIKTAMLKKSDTDEKIRRFGKS